MSNALIDRKLQELGVSKRYMGYHFLKHAVVLALEDETRLGAVINRIYIPVADKFNCNQANVIKDIGTVSNIIWKNHREKLFEIAHCEMAQEPPVSELISVITADIQRSEAEKEIK